MSGNLLTGLAAVTLVSLLLIGWRVAVITGGFMALVLLGSLTGLWAVGYTLNTITLFGLILTLGLLVDDAIVISESIDASRDEPDPAEADPGLGVIRRAIDRVGSASLAGTLTTVVVFSPMLFVGGILGEFIRPIPATVIVTLLMSFAFSIVFIPAIARLFLLRGGPSRNPIVRAEKRAAAAMGRLASYPSGNGWRGRFAGVQPRRGRRRLRCSSACSSPGGSGSASSPQARMPSGSSSPPSSRRARRSNEARERSERIDAVVVDVLGDELDRSQYVRGNERVIETFIDLTPIDERSTTAPTFVERIEAGVADIDGARISVNQTESGPPVLEFPFAVQISVATRAASPRARRSLQRSATISSGATFTSGRDTVTVIDALVSTAGEVARIDGDRYIEVRAKYDEDNGISGVLTSTEDYVTAAFGSTLAERGLAADALAFDFGLESDNQDDFAALGVAGMVALGLMLVLITVQFRSLAQSALIFLAIPFSFLGVFSALTVTDNPLELPRRGRLHRTDRRRGEQHDPARRRGQPGPAPRERPPVRPSAPRCRSRFRPLVATTITTVVGLLPLSLADPFWESLGFTLMGGLVSSTLLVLIAFPAFYLGPRGTPHAGPQRVRRGGGGRW